MDGIAAVCHQHDIPSRQAMKYLLTMGWFLAHTSLAMTPEHSATNKENSPLRSARPGHSRSMHVPLIPQSSCVTKSTHTPVARQAQMAALLNWQRMRPHATSQISLQHCSAHGDFPVDWADLICRTNQFVKHSRANLAWTYST